MKKILLICIGVSFFVACFTQTGVSSESVEFNIRKLIQNTCKPNQSCKIKLNQATSFDWDQFYFFDMSVEEAVVSKTLGFEYESSAPTYSRKWIFLRNGKIVHAEEHQIPEVDKPIEVGDVDLEVSDQNNKHGTFDNDAEFEAVSLTIDDGLYYRLRCVNCK